MSAWKYDEEASGWLSASARILGPTARSTRRPRTLHSPGCAPTHLAGGDAAFGRRIEGGSMRGLTALTSIQPYRLTA